ncbi:MAG: DUF3887 domain-containing protein [Oculatellaceae cyanobacterium Prado106]|jgi:hypothetical protein|nr:DUF3887 domain-containing protein [Oculatellaceae cyanobacterium Prado106]
MQKFFVALMIPAALILGAVPAQAQGSAIVAAPMQVAQVSDVSMMAEEFMMRLDMADFSGAVGMYSSAANVSSESLQQTWQDVIATNGELQEQLGMETVSDSGDSQVVLVTCQFEQGMREVYINFVNGKVVDFSMGQ